MSFYTIKGWPHVRVSFTGLPQEESEFRAFLQELTNLYAHKQRFTFLFDTRNFTQLPMQYISGLAQWIGDNGENAKAFLDKSAVLIVNPAVRIFLNALFAVRKPSAPLQVCGSLRDCVNYLGWQKK